MAQKAIIAMSGGVDSSVAALLTLKDGLECVGVTLKLFENSDVGAGREDSCCSLEDAEDARRVAYSIGMPHYVFDFGEDFRRDVIDRFVSEYTNGRTPNPCIDCNRFIKFKRLMERMDAMDFDYIVTGHYARVGFDENSKRYFLKKAVDERKDQSYVLYGMNQHQLAHTRFPLGGFNKSEVREIAAENGFVNAKKHDSQDICFVMNGKYADFIEEYTGEIWPCGDFVDDSGRTLGRHKGIIRYTIGQRRGLGLALPAPLYVREKRIRENTVVLSPKTGIFYRKLVAKDINLIAVARIDQPTRVMAKVSYNQPEAPATVIQQDEDTLRVEFDEPMRAVTAGQALVLYDGDTVLGGGTIVSAG